MVPNTTQTVDSVSFTVDCLSTHQLPSSSSSPQTRAQKSLPFLLPSCWSSAPLIQTVVQRSSTRLQPQGFSRNSDPLPCCSCSVRYSTSSSSSLSFFPPPFPSPAIPFLVLVPPSSPFPVWASFTSVTNHRFPPASALRFLHSFRPTHGTIPHAYSSALCDRSNPQQRPRVTQQT